MNYHQGLKTELEAREPELTACQELGHSLLLNKSAMADEVCGAQGLPSAPCRRVGAYTDPSPSLPDPGTTGQAKNPEGGGVREVGPPLGMAAAE